MNKKIFLFIVLVFFFSLSSKVYANLIITKVVYDSPPDGAGDWIEVQNTGSASVEVRGNENGNPWKISTTETATKKYNFNINTLIINPNERVAFVCNIDKFNQIESYNGNIVEITVNGFNDKGGYIKIWDNNSSLIASYQYPSFTSSSDNNEEENDTTSSSNTTTSSSTSSKEEVKIIPTFKANILAPSLAFAGQPVSFDLDVRYGSDIYAVGKYFWNFGDGSSMTKVDGFSKFTHIYYYPGEYNVSLDYFKNKSSTEPDARDEMIIKVIPLTISISKVGDEKDFFVELTNNSDTKIDISNWYLSGNNKYFLFPKNTIILPKKSIIFSGIVTGFTKADQYSLKLFSSTNELVFNYNPIVKRIVTNSQKVSKTIYPINNELSLLNNKIMSTDGNKDFILTPNNFTNDVQGASSINSNDFLQNNNKSSIYFWIFVFLIIISIFTVYFLRRNREEDKASNADDFEILDE